MPTLSVIVTNGDALAATLRIHCVDADIIPWRDVLWEGPVPANFDDRELAEVRARHLASAFSSRFRDDLAMLLERDDQFATARWTDSITLLFEPDLTDQLQLLQCLDRIARWSDTGAAVCLAECRAPLRTAADTRAALLGARALTTGILALGRAAFEAFRAPDPIALLALLAADTSPLPDLRNALIDLLGDLPAPGSGLSASEAAILTCLEQGACTPAKLFAELARRGDPLAQRGDWCVFAIISRLASTPPAAIAGLDGCFPIDGSTNERGAFLDSRISLTDCGKALLGDELDLTQLAPPHRWLGGMQLTPENLWRWSRTDMHLIPPDRLLAAP
ncbi:MAG TPA: hypothetical protein PK264_12670 [Hyphomicrobiaceae bacterium]|nr:hypothetical protein [Hyphomicrobiaceae bacterium]